MFGSELREVTWVGVSMILVSFVLLFIAVMLNFRADFAEAYNSRVYSSEVVKEMREFNLYDGTELFGEDVVSAIGLYHKSDITIRVDNRIGCRTCNHAIYRETSNSNGIYQISKDLLSRYNSRVPSEQKDRVIDSEFLFLNEFTSDNVYKSVLVYGNEDISKVTKTYKPKTTSKEVTGIVFFFERKRTTP